MRCGDLDDGSAILRLGIDLTVKGYMGRRAVIWRSASRRLMLAEYPLYHYGSVGLYAVRLGRNDVYHARIHRDNPCTTCILFASVGSWNGCCTRDRHGRLSGLFPIFKGSRWRFRAPSHPIALHVKIRRSVASDCLVSEQNSTRIPVSRAQS